MRRPNPRPAPGSRVAASGTTWVMIGSPALCNEIGGAMLRFVVTTPGGGAARCALRIGGQSPATRRGLEVLEALLRAGGRRVEDDSRARLIRAVSGLRAKVTLAVNEAGFAQITEVLE